ncbi:sigma-70 family RNA polymerase sigma factor [Streptomyces sp. NA02950]|uniref:RNA polymerase sigma factor n=1 Tax=Streptomyces sp. NA02950 TaxID=2742137 RepID=UPI00158FF741|nr:sigma-70 family RNA polymerase sigma factor [Streptomyces sp. NA02950]QKV91786.1 sigma-70 family RNA polymerase sigma factor [Streptomyces sp. NA02950]
MHQGPAALDAAAYSRLYEAEYPRLVAYARTLTGNPWTAGDLVAEARYRVWRRLRTGQPIGADAVPAELTGAVRGLSAAAASWGPPQRGSYLEPLVDVLGELPQRWVTALWHAEVDGLSPEGVARRLGTHADGAAALVERARESLRQEYLRAQPGAPASAACGAHWERMPAHVQGVDTPHQAEQIAVHIEGCQDCRSRMERMVAADDRLPALTGPALLALLDRGTAKWLVPLAATAVGATAVGTATRTLPLGGAHAAAAGGTLVSARRSVRHLMRGQVRQAGPVAATVAGVGVLLVASAAVAAGLALTDADQAGPGQPAAASAPSDPGGAGVPSDGGDSSASSGSSETSGTSPRTSDDLRSEAAREASRNRPSTGRSPSDVPSSAVSPSGPASSSAAPSSSPSSQPTSPGSSASSSPGEPSDPSSPPTGHPTDDPTDGGTSEPTRSGEPSGTPSESATPSDEPTEEPTEEPTAKPTDEPTAKPTASSDDSAKDCVSVLARVCVDNNR